MKTKTIITLLAAACLTTSCGEMGTSIDDLVQATAVTLSTHELTVWEGDTYAMRCEMQPKDYDGMLYWFSDTDSCLTMLGHMLNAHEKGEAWAYVKYVPIGIEPTRDIADGTIYDRCRVKVINWGKINLQRNYPHSMVYYAAITIDGQPLPDEVELSVMTPDNALRGYACRRSAHGIDYVELRIYGDYDDLGMPLTLWIYDHRNISLKSCLQQLEFVPMQTYGTLSALYPMALTTATSQP